MAGHKCATKITEHHKRLIRLKLDGMLDKEVADKMGNALATIKRHYRNIYQMLGVRNVAELNKEVIRLHLLD